MALLSERAETHCCALFLPASGNVSTFASHGTFAEMAQIYAHTALQVDSSRKPELKLDYMKLREIFYDEQHGKGFGNVAAKMLEDIGVEKEVVSHFLVAYGNSLVKEAEKANEGEEETPRKKLIALIKNAVQKFIDESKESQDRVTEISDGKSGEGGGGGGGGGEAVRHAENAQIYLADGLSKEEESIREEERANIQAQPSPSPVFPGRRRGIDHRQTYTPSDLGHQPRKRRRTNTETVKPGVHVQKIADYLLALKPEEGFTKWIEELSYLSLTKTSKLLPFLSASEKWSYKEDAAGTQWLIAPGLKRGEWSEWKENVNIFKDLGQLRTVLHQLVESE